jgi:hypothetical protein
MQTPDRAIENRQWYGCELVARELGKKTGLWSYLGGYTEEEEGEILRRVGKIIKTSEPKKRDERRKFWKEFTSKYVDRKLWDLATRTIALADEKEGKMYVRMSGCKGVCATIGSKGRAV